MKYADKHKILLVKDELTFEIHHENKIKRPEFDTLIKGIVSKYPDKYKLHKWGHGAGKDFHKIYNQQKINISDTNKVEELFSIIKETYNDLHADIEDYYYNVYLNQNTRPKMIKIRNKVEIVFPTSFIEYRQFYKNFKKELDIPKKTETVNVIFNKVTYKDLTLGDKKGDDGRIYFSKEKAELFLNNNKEIKKGDVIEIEVEFSYKAHDKKNDFSLNKILFGPPGTGKTYHTVNEAVKIVEELSDDAFEEKYGNDRKKLKEAFKNYLEEAEPHIAFTTFHQSFSYEDFIEGIKPVMKSKSGDTTIIKKPDNVENANDLEYEIQDGIFKRISQSADAWDKIVLSEKEINEAIFYKISLGNSQFEDDEEIYKYCIENNKIALGWGGDINYENINDENEIQKMAKSVGIGDIPARTISYFKLNLKKGNYIVISKGNTRIRAIAKVTGEYYYNENSPIEYNHFRDVEWLIKDKNIPVKDFYEKQFMQHTLYKLKNKFVNNSFFNTSEVKTEEKDEKIIRRNHVLIIDEINRGNVSSIFGELITLIEDDKRIGKDEELKITLPYSKEKFGVPPNLHIIGTMNTADRSIEALDTALRRRFTFKEMPPKTDVIVNKGVLKEQNGILNGIDFAKMLETINARIEKLIDKDHKIGHSYLMNVATIEELRLSFKDKIIPLLEEYFYGDFGKIGLVLGNDFIEEQNNKDDFYFAEFKGYDNEIIDDFKQRKVYKFTNYKNWNAECFINIYTPIKN